MHSPKADPRPSLCYTYEVHTPWLASSANHAQAIGSAEPFLGHIDSASQDL
ncbi:MAG: hypothetical protein ACO3DD_02925 [Burkholderiaceae bacterium]|jgi:hypothetical protein